MVVTAEVSDGVVVVHGPNVNTCTTVDATQTAAAVDADAVSTITTTDQRLTLSISKEENGVVTTTAVDAGSGREIGTSCKDAVSSCIGAGGFSTNGIAVEAGHSTNGGHDGDGVSVCTTRD